MCPKLQGPISERTIAKSDVFNLTVSNMPALEVPINMIYLLLSCWGFINLLMRFNTIHKKRN